MNLDDLYSSMATNNDRYLLIKNFFTENDLQECKNLALSCADQPDDEYGDYKSKLFEPNEEFSEDHILCQIDIKKIAEAYGLDNLDGHFWEVAMDGPSFSNGFHTDVKFSKKYVTLQWYLDMDDHNRCFYISDGSHKKVTDGTPLNTVPNTLLSFRAAKNSFHGFEEGEGTRLNIRLRFWEDLVNDDRVHNYDEQDKICWLVDVKDMEVEDYPEDEMFEDLEGRLANTTYFNLTNLQQNNIMVTTKWRQYPKHLTKLKEMGFERCVVLMAGVIVNDKTVDFVREPMDSAVYGNVAGDYLYRGITLVDLTKIDTQLAEGFDPYWGNHVDVSKHVRVKQFNAIYVHPETENANALWKITESMYNQAKKDDRLDQDDRERIEDMSDYLNEITTEMPEVEVTVIEG